MSEMLQQRRARGRSVNSSGTMSRNARHKNVKSRRVSGLSSGVNASNRCTPAVQNSINLPNRKRRSERIV